MIEELETNCVGIVFLKKTTYQRYAVCLELGDSILLKKQGENLVVFSDRMIFCKYQNRIPRPIPNCKLCRV